MIILNIIIDPACAPLCGLEIDVAYNSELLYLSSCERGQGMPGMNFDCSLKEGKIRLLFWSQSNCRVGGNIATVCFLPVDNAANGEKCEFYLSLPTKNSAIAYDGENITAKELVLSGLEFILCAEGQENIIPPDTEKENVSSETDTTPVGEPTTEPAGEAATDFLPPEQAEKGQNADRETPNGRTRKFGNFVTAMLVAVSCFELVELIPLFVPNVFRKGYF
ncbi:MAG: hypothetical protein E7667_06135 [Ruminococcaceae bacterium]|nr:hypothetical protein [Oscillospiraceae bacterium]